MPSLAIIIKWNPYIHGASASEGSDIINYLQQKYLVYANYERHNISKNIDMLQSDIDYIYCNNLTLQRNPCDLKISIIKKHYFYRDRCFALRNYGIEKLQRKWRDYYQRKIRFLKSFENLKYREVNGKYPLLSYNKEN